MTDRLALTTQEAAESLGVSERTVREWTGRGLLRVVRVGAVVRYMPDTLMEDLRELAAYSCADGQVRAPLATPLPSTNGGVAVPYGGMARRVVGYNLATRS